VELAHHRVQPGLAAGLRPAGDHAQVEDLIRRHARQALAAADRPLEVAGVALAQPVGGRAAVGVVLHTHPVLGAGRQARRLDVVRRETLGLDQFERQRHARAAEATRVDADQHLAGLEDLRHRGAFEVVEVKLAAGVAAIGVAPLPPRRLDRVVNVLAQGVARAADLRLHADAGADDVVDHHLARAAGKGGVAHQLARACAQVDEAAVQLGVGAGFAAAEAGGEARLARARVHARLDAGQRCRARARGRCGRERRLEQRAVVDLTHG
jgi:hypothetical protein